MAIPNVLALEEGTVIEQYYKVHIWGLWAPSGRLEKEIRRTEVRHLCKRYLAISLPDTIAEDTLFSLNY